MPKSTIATSPPPLPNLIMALDSRMVSQKFASGHQTILKDSRQVVAGFQRFVTGS